MTIEILNAPNSDPLTLSEVRGYLRIGTDGDDAMLLTVLKAAIIRIETKYGKAFIARKIRESFSMVEVENAYFLAKKNGRKPFLRPFYSPIISIDLVKINGIPNNNQVLLEDNLFILNGLTEPVQIEYTTGMNTPIGDEYKILILEEIGRIITARDNQNNSFATGPRL